MEHDDILDALFYAQSALQNHYKKKEKNVMLNLKCKVCGTEFPALKERHYISFQNIYGAPELYDTFDCPFCDCQVIAQSRKPMVDGEMYTDEDIRELIRDLPMTDILKIKGLPVSLEIKKFSCDHEQRPASLYFDSLEKASSKLALLRDELAKYGYLSIRDVSNLLGGEHNLASNWGWADLSSARVVAFGEGYVISFPALRGRYQIFKEEKK